MTKSVDQRRQAVETFIHTHAERLAGQGAIVRTWRRRDGRKLGPYYLLVVRDAAGRQRSVYLGAAGPLVDEIRERLNSWQRGRRECWNVAAARKSLRRAVANGNQVLDGELAALGLYRKGFEIRGWRCQRTRRLTIGGVGSTGFHKHSLRGSGS
jgi:hypothetical protein